MRGAVRRWISIGLVGGVAAVAIAQDVPAIAKYVPGAPDPAHVFVLDSAHLLSPQTLQALQDSARALQTETAADVAWVTLPTLGRRPIEEAALYIGRTWRIGSAGQPGDPLRNRGLVILYIPDKTTTAGANFRVEVGNGLEGTITDSRSRAISLAMRDELRAKHYDAAYMAGWGVAAALVRTDFASHATGAQKAALAASAAAAGARSESVAQLEPSSFNPIIPGLFLVLIVGLLILFISSRRRATRAPVMAIPRSDDDDEEERRRRKNWFMSSSSGSTDFSSGDSGSSSSSDGGSFGDGGGFSGGGSSDTI